MPVDLHSLASDTYTPRPWTRVVHPSLYSPIFRVYGEPEIWAFTLMGMGWIENSLIDVYIVNEPKMIGGELVSTSRRLERIKSGASGSFDLQYPYPKRLEVPADTYRETIFFLAKSVIEGWGHTMTAKVWGGNAPWFKS